MAVAGEPPRSARALLMAAQIALADGDVLRAADLVAAANAALPASPASDASALLRMAAELKRGLGTFLFSENPDTGLLGAVPVRRRS